MARPHLIIAALLGLHRSCALSIPSDKAADQTVIVHGTAPVPGPPGGFPWALLIDAGSTGSRMHLYEWAPRNFQTLPPPISLPFTSEQWTVRMSPGISQYSSNPAEVSKALIPLINYAKEQLQHVSDQWSTFPIFLKATAGMRQLPLKERVAIIREIRAYFSNNESCPFLFSSPEQVRVISGEEEAAYAWAGVNFVTGALLDSSWGTGTATPINAFGTLEMGGASHQIAFFQPEQSILANLFKLQIGSTKHWNLYAHSHLQYGRVSAKDRMWSQLAENAGCFDASADGSLSHCEFVDQCLAQGLSVMPFDSVSGRSEVHPPMRLSPVNEDVMIRSVDKSHTGQWGACLDQIVNPLGFGGHEKILRNHWCNFSHLGQCSYAGVYQPSIPVKTSPYGEFILIGGYVHVFNTLNFGNGTTVNLLQLREKATEVCALDHITLIERFNISEVRNRTHAFQDIDVNVESTAEQLCFLAAYSFAILHYGHGFELDRNFTVVETMEYGGSLLKVGWQLGAILYEINALPWTYDPLDALAVPNPNTYSANAVYSGNLLFFPLALLGCGIVFLKWRGATSGRNEVKVQEIQLPYRPFSAQHQPTYQAIASL